MSALFRIVYAAHANGTHHKLALDALRVLQRPDAEDWRRLFLKNVALYLEGSKAPDVSFKDFKNHVLHVADDYWGGAPEKVEAWYGHVVTALREEKWTDAVYAAGVLSHYYTDPVHPFHTGQTEAENAVHRAVEWSINRSYDALRSLGEERFGALDVSLPSGPGWQRAAVCAGADFSHRYYEKLLAHYDIHRGVVAPPEGLDSVAQGVVCELLMYAATGFGRVLERAIDEAGVAAPQVSLTLDTVIAAAGIPRKWIEKKLSNAEDRRLVQAMYDELTETGRVEATLPEDDRTIRDLYAKEVLAPKLAQRSATRAQRVPGGDPADARRHAQRDAVRGRGIAPAVSAGRPGAEAKAAPPAAAPAPLPRQTLPPPIAAVTTQAVPAQLAPTPVPASVQAPPTRPPAEPVAQQSVPTIARSRGEGSRARRHYLALDDDLEAAPSIGPKMAARFAELGIVTVKDFLGHDPHDMAELLDDTRFDAEVLTDWQDQAQLVLEVAGLRGTHAQLLVGAGYRTAGAVAEADPVDLCADVLKFAASGDGKRVLRDGEPPDIEKIKDWVSSANAAMAA